MAVHELARNQHEAGDDDDATTPHDAGLHPRTETRYSMQIAEHRSTVQGARGGRGPGRAAVQQNESLARRRRPGGNARTNHGWISDPHAYAGRRIMQRSSIYGVG